MTSSRKEAIVKMREPSVLVEEVEEEATSTVNPDSPVVSGVSP